MRIWHDLPDLRDPDRFDAWLYRILVNACYHELRRNRRRSMEVELDPLIDLPVPDGSASLAERDAIERGFRRLDPEQRVIVVLNLYLGYSIPEVADILAVPQGTAKSRLHRALSKLRAALDADARTNPDPRPGAHAMNRVHDVVLSVRAWLFDEGESPMTPDYIDDILARTAAIKQRPAWQSPWRWLIMRTTDTIRTVPRIAWPVLIAVILAALAFGVAAGPRAAGMVGVTSPSHTPASSAVPSPTATTSSHRSRTDSRRCTPRRRTVSSRSRRRTATRTARPSSGSSTRTAPVAGRSSRHPTCFDGLTWAPDGRHLAYWAWSGGQATERMTLMVADADGNGSRALFDNGDTAAPPIVWSPDSTMIAVDDGRLPSTTSVIDATTGAVVLTHPGSMPTWSPDSSRLAIVADELQVLGLDGVVETTLGHGAGSHPEWSPDGKHIVFATAGRHYTHNVVRHRWRTAARTTSPTPPTRPADAADRLIGRRMGSHVLYEDSGFRDDNGRGYLVTDATGGTFTKLAIPDFGAQWSPDGLSHPEPAMATQRDLDVHHRPDRPSTTNGHRRVRSARGPVLDELAARRPVAQEI